MGTSPFFFRDYKMLNRGLDKQELLRIVEAVADEKSIDKELSNRFNGKCDSKSSTYKIWK